MTDTKTVVKNLNDIASELRELTRKLDRSLDERNMQYIRAVIEREGLEHFMPMVAQIVRDIGHAHVRFSEPWEDFRMASEIIDVAAVGCDLMYGKKESGAQRARINALKEFQILAMRVKA
jgi:RNA polymerase-interacting CarD/CdnL/TRCF family regulator